MGYVEALSPMETLAQSVCTIAPGTTAVATIPLVCALAGEGTGLAYALAIEPRTRRLRSLEAMNSRRI